MLYTPVTLLFTYTDVTGMIGASVSEPPIDDVNGSRVRPSSYVSQTAHARYSRVWGERERGAIFVTIIGWRAGASLPSRTTGAIFLCTV